MESWENYFETKEISWYWDLSSKLWDFQQVLIWILHLVLQAYTSYLRNSCFDTFFFSLPWI
jgi:hypothetical protein